MDNRIDPDPDDADALSAYWDAVARGVPDPPTAGLDQDTVALVRRVRRAAGGAIPPGGRDRALTAAMHERADHAVRPNGQERRSAVSTMTVLVPPRAVGSANGWTDPHRGRAATLPVPIAPRRRVGSAVSLACAAILLLALVGGLVAVRFGAPGSDDGRFGSLPAAQVSPDATPAGIAAETFAAVEFPAEAVPSGGGVAVVGRLIVDPGVTVDLADLTNLGGVEGNAVVAGRAGMTSTDAMRVVRADGAIEDVPPGTEALLGQGETAVFLAEMGSHALRNAGAGPLELVAFGIYDTAEPAPPGSAGGPPAGVSLEGLGYLSPDLWARAALPSGPLRVTLRRVTLNPGAALPPAPTSWPALRHVASGTLTWAAAPADGTPAPGATLRFSAGYDVPWTPLNDRLLTLRNDGDEPVVFWELAIEPAGGGAVTPMI